MKLNLCAIILTLIYWLVAIKRWELSIALVLLFMIFITLSNSNKDKAFLILSVISLSLVVNYALFVIVAGSPSKVLTFFIVFTLHMIILKSHNFKSWNELLKGGKKEETRKR